MAHETTMMDPNQHAELLARRLAVAEEEKREKHRKKLAASAKAKRDAESGKVILEDGRAVEPLNCYMDKSVGDFTFIPRELVKPGWVTRWVKHEDAEGRRTSLYLDQRRQFGYEVIKGEDGQPLTYGRLTAMQAPPEGAAAWMVKFARPGSLTAAAAMDRLEAIVDEENRRAGKRVLETFETAEHGSHHLP